MTKTRARGPEIRAAAIGRKLLEKHAGGKYHGSGLAATFSIALSR